MSTLAHEAPASGFSRAAARFRPAFILWRHVIQEMIAPTLLGFGVFTFLMLMRFLLRISQIWIQYGAELATVLWAIVYSLPFIVVLTLPMGLLVGGLIAFGRMSSDFEIVALRASGVSLLHLMPPVLILAGIAWAVTSYVFMVSLPWGNTSLREMNWETITKRAFSGEIKPRVFIEDFPGLVLYIEDIVDDGREWRGVFAARTDNDPPNIVRAERGFLRIDDDTRKTYLLLENGTLIGSAEDPLEATVTRFDRQTMLIYSEEEDGSVLGQLGKDGRSMTLTELRRTITDRQQVGDPAYDLQVEVHKKYAFPFACIIMGLISLPLGISTQRQTTAAGFGIGTAVIVVYYFFLQNGEQQGDVGNIQPWLGMWAGNLIMGTVALVLLWKKSREVDFGIVRGVQPLLERRSALVHRLRRLLRRPARRAGRRRGASFPRLLDRYVLRSYAAIWMLTFAAFVTIFATTTWIDKASYVAHPEMIPTYMKFQIWEIVFNVLPMSAVVTVLATFSLMAKRNEVVAALAGGVSLYRLMLPILLPAVALTAAQYGVQDYVLPTAAQQAAIVEEQMHPTGAVSLQRDQTWVFSEGGRVFHFAEYVAEPPQLLGLRVYYLNDGTGGIARMEFAERAEFTNDRWEGHDGWRRYFIAEDQSARLSPTELEEFRFSVLPIELTPSYFGESPLQPEQMSTLELQQHVELLQQRGYETHRALVDLNMKAATPAIVFVMTVVGIPFAFRMGRQGALTGVGIAIGLVAVYWIAFGVFRALGYAGQLPPGLAAWAPHLLFLSLGGYQALGVRT